MQICGHQFNCQTLLKHLHHETSDSPAKEQHLSAPLPLFLVGQINIPRTAEFMFSIIHPLIPVQNS